MPSLSKNTVEKEIKNDCHEHFLPSPLCLLLINMSHSLTNTLYIDKSISTHYHTIPTFDASEKEAFRKHCGKKKKMLVTSIFSFFTMFSTLHKTNFKFSVTFILSSAIPFNFDKPKILSLVIS